MIHRKIGNVIGRPKCLSFQHKRENLGKKHKHILQNKSKIQGASEVETGIEIAAQSLQILSHQTATLCVPGSHLQTVNKATAGDLGWCCRGPSDGHAPANLFTASLKQFQNQFQIWQAVSILLLLCDGSDMLTAIRLLHMHIGACSAYSLLEKPKKHYYNHLTWGHGHMLHDLCLRQQSPWWNFDYCPEGLKGSAYPRCDIGKSKVRAKLVVTSMFFNTSYRSNQISMNRYGSF